MNWKVPLTASVVTAVQMTLGAVVVGTDAGFSCPDWPLCNGVLVPRLDGLVALELVHRGTALVVMALVGWFAVGALRQSTDGRLRRLAWGVVASVGVQVVVGGLIVLTHAPGITTTVDVINSMLLLSLLVTAALHMRRREERPEAAEAPLVWRGSTLAGDAVKPVAEPGTGVGGEFGTGAGGDCAAGAGEACAAGAGGEFGTGAGGDCAAGAAGESRTRFGGQPRMGASEACAAAAAGEPGTGAQGERQGLSSAVRRFHAAVWLAVLVGAVFRHTGESEALFGRNDYLASHGQYVMPSEWGAHIWLLAHMSTGVLLAAAAIDMAARAVRGRRAIGGATVSVAAVAVQGLLGDWTLRSELGLLPATLHWANASLLVALAAGLREALGRRADARVPLAWHHVDGLAIPPVHGNWPRTARMRRNLRKTGQEGAAHRVRRNVRETGQEGAAHTEMQPLQ